MAYGTLLLDYQVDDMIFTSETGAIGAGTSNPEIRRNKPPVMETSGDSNRTVKVGEPLVLTANVTDDGIPKPRPRGALLDRTSLDNVKDMRLLPPHQVTVGSATGLWVSLYVYREDTSGVHISPDQPETWEDTRAGANAQWSPLWAAPPPPDGNNWTATATFDKPGDYILRWHASDGALWVDHNIHVTVVPK